MLFLFFNVFYVVGIVLFFKDIFSGLWFIYKKFIRSQKDIISIYGKNTWALITGASDGIGKAFCEELAQYGFNICLLARNKEKLDQVEREIRRLNPNISTKVVVSDLSKAYEEGFCSEIEQQIQDLDISILVNNAGIGGSNTFERMQFDHIKNLVITNALSPVLITRCIVPTMLKREKKSAIINLSSFCASRPLPYASVYGSTKIFDDFMARSLAIEYENKIDCLALRPNWVSTKLSTKRLNNFDVISSNKCVVDALKELGYEKVTAGNWIHSMLEWFIGTFAPDYIVKIAGYRVLNIIDKIK